MSKNARSRNYKLRNFYKYVTGQEFIPTKKAPPGYVIYKIGYHCGWQFQDYSRSTNDWTVKDAVKSAWDHYMSLSKIKSHEDMSDTDQKVMNPTVSSTSRWWILS